MSRIQKIRQSSPRWLGAAGILLIIGTGIGLLCVILADQRAALNRRICLSNLRQIGQAFSQYVTDYDGSWPDLSIWTEGELSHYGELKGCPSAQPMLVLPGLKASGVPGYAYNDLLSLQYVHGTLLPIRMADILFPATTISVSEQAIGISSSKTVDPYQNLPSRPIHQERGWMRHGGGAHYLFCDGHVLWLAPKDVDDYSEMGRNDGKTPSFSPQ